MRFFNSMKMYLVGSFLFGWKAPDHTRIFYYQSKSYLDRFLMKRKPSNKLVSVSISNGPLYFRDNWFDPRSVPFIFDNDYLALDPKIFDGCRTFIDVGANMGLISRSLRLHSPNCKITCFEPLEENAALCRMNNPGAVVETCAIGARSGNAELLVDSCGFMASSIKFGYAQAPRKVPVVSLDAYLKYAEGPFDLIKIDVEGMEMSVLEGARATLSRTRRVIAEVHSDALDAAFGDKMREYGFSLRKRIKVERGIYIVDYHNPETRSV